MSASGPGARAGRPALGFVGLGVMGAPMAARLLDAGYEVVAHNRSAARLERIAERGARRAANPAEVAAASDVLITMLPDSPDVLEVVAGEHGVLAGSRPGLLWVDMSTIRPDVARRLADEAAGRGVRSLDAPVSGGERGAIDGTLSIMVGGEAEDLERARPVLEVLGSTITHAGGHGAGQTVKAANQLVVAGTIELVAEAVVLLEASGIDPATGLQAIAAGLGGNRVIERKSAAMIAHEFAPGFRLALHLKDLRIAGDAAGTTGVVLPLTALVTQLVQSLVAQGHGGEDHGALLLLVEQLSGRA
jgi:2-hydroxy-3-oxopropionate reductase